MSTKNPETLDKKTTNWNDAYSRNLKSPAMHKKKGTLILLNGGSSVGKTSLIEAFQNLMFQQSVDYWHFGTDSFFYMLPPALINRDMNKLEQFYRDYFYFDMQTKDGEPYPVFKAGKRIQDFFHSRYLATKAFLDSGQNMLVDEVVFNDDYIHSMVTAFSDNQAYLIKIFTTPEIAKQREMKRADRPPNLYRSSADYSHKNMIYDAEIDTSAISPEKAADKLLQIIKDIPKPQALFELSRRYG